MHSLNFKTSFQFYCLTLMMMISFNVNSSENLLKQIDDIRKSNQISAAVVILVNKDEALIQAFFGKSSWETNNHIKQKSMFRIGSISKSFAGILAMKMQQLGLIDLSQTLKHYLKKDDIKNKFEAEITLQQLLEHSAGLTDLSKAEWDYNKSQRISLEQALDLKLGQHVTQWQPGLHKSYSNVGTAYLALALEKASGKTYEQLMDEYVFQPLEMKSSTLFLENHVTGRLIQGYNTDGKTPIPYWHNIYRPFAAINTDANDMVNLLKLMLNKGQYNNQQYLTAQEITRIETPTTSLAAQSGLAYGYGLGVYQWQTNGYRFYGHGGDADGYLSKYGYNRESGLAYFVMINAFQKKTLNQIRHVIEEYITEELPKPHYPLRLVLHDKELTQYTGKYKKVTSRFKKESKPNEFEFKIIEQEGGLFILHPSGLKEPIYAVNNSHFRFINESEATMAFTKHEAQMYLQGDRGNFVKIE